MMFADDCVLYKSDECCNNILTRLQKGLDSYTTWGSANNMYLNVSKTKTMLITPTPHYNLHRPLTFNNKEIQYVHTFNYLGLLLDDKLTFTPHYRLVKRRIENNIFVLSKVRKYINNETAVLIFKQAILPIAEYAGFVLCSCNLGQKRELQKLQNNALRICKRFYLLDRISIDRLHYECKILGLEQRRRNQLLRLMYLYSKDVENIKQPLRATRATTKVVFKTPARCEGKYLNSCYYKGTILWNVLSREQQMSDNVNQFANVLRGLYNRYQEIW